MELNDKYVLIFRKKKLIASCIDGQMPAMYLQISDVVIMNLLFLQDTLSPEEILQNHLLSGLSKNISPTQIQARVQQLINGHIIKLKPQSNPTIYSIRPNDFNDCDALMSEAALIPAMNLAITHNKGRWLFWSAICQDYIECDIEDILLITAFAENPQTHEVANQYSDIISNDGIHFRIKNLKALGALVDKPVNPSITHKPSTQSINQEINPHEQWQYIDANPNLIPVYFVPHMKNHYPLALGVLFSAIKHHDNGALLNKYQLIPINYMSPGELFNGPYRKFGPGIWLFSNYMWSLDINMQVSEAVKKHNSNNITIHGGPSTPDYPQADIDFMTKYKSVDISVHGEGEVAIIEVLNTINRQSENELIVDSCIQNVTGITIRNIHDNDNEIHRSPSRTRMKTPDAIPSPYLSGCFDGYGAEVEAAIIETNRGCPFGCTFCDWGSATNQKVQKFDLQRVKDEIDWIAHNKVRVLWIADANYGLYDRDIELAKYIVNSKQKTGYPEEVVVNYTKNSTWRLVEIIKVFNEGGIISQGIISIQTTDEKTLDVINRKNIKTEKYDELTKVFYDLKLPLSTDLMLGLPGMTVDAFNKDIQKYIDMDVSVKAYPTQLLPNSPMADPEYIKKYQIETDDKDFLISTFSYTHNELKWMKAMYHIYTIADGYGLLRYVIRYLQWQYQIKATDFLSDLLTYVNKNPADFPKITWAIRYFIGDKTMPGGWADFYQQIGEFISQNYGIEMDSGFETVFKVSQYCMPDNSLRYPLTFKIQHDFSAYFAQNIENEGQRQHALTDYPATNFQVSDPNNMVSIDMDYLQYDSHQYFWELHSDVARPKSSSEFAKETVTSD